MRSPKRFAIGLVALLWLLAPGTFVSPALAAGAASEPGGDELASATLEALAGYSSRPLLRVGDLRFYWRRAEDEIFVTLLPARIREAQEDIGALLGGALAATMATKDPAAATPPSSSQLAAGPSPRNIVMAADEADARGLLRALGASARELGGPAPFQSASRPGWLILLSPRAAALGVSWRELLRHELAHYALAGAGRGGAPELPAWLSEAIAARIDGRFEAPLGRTWSLPSRAEIAAFFAEPPPAGAGMASQGPMTAIAPPGGASQAELVMAYLTLRGLLRAQGPGGLQALLGQGGRARSSKTLPSLLRREWRRERKERSFTGAAKSPRRAPEVLRLQRLARLLAHAGLYGAAAKELRKAFEKSGDVEIGLRLLPLDIQNGDWESARKLCRGLPRRGADGFSYRFLCGQLYVARQEYPRAIEALQGAVDIEPYSVDAHSALRDVYERLKRSREKLDASVILKILTHPKAQHAPGRSEEAP
jgi:tetratricopeptide (TPR) repeat protein